MPQEVPCPCANLNVKGRLEQQCYPPSSKFNCTLHEIKEKQQLRVQAKVPQVVPCPRTSPSVVLQK